MMVHGCRVISGYLRVFVRVCPEQVSVRILGGLMALGYEIGTIMKRNSIIHSDDRLTIKLDTIEGMGHGFVQVCLLLSWGLNPVQGSLGEGKGRGQGIQRQHQS